ncbi:MULTISPECIES: triose-phosphate isomerase [unclassified Guyparkeria]|uniref:triose-phosphate isomerase n=1 Tax=unclassified Guyparkeria TaxID=2626246 RepID=UPI0007337A2C|nr:MULTISPECIES: triose-phosphate isomerase [unclassified Guyparkeria]KTG16249.1 triose-phosphate isomerase [Guyparkeria sp. XI15]OAE85100.1 triose-phosphate isomerase [Guyparkeria sp. WRN-7]
MRKPIVVGNWKLNGSSADNESLVLGVLDGMRELAGIDVGVCPPFVYLPQVAKLAEATDLGLGAQNCSEHDSGAFTGEVAPGMLHDVGARYVIVGHSERRAMYGETDAIVSDKVKAALAAGLTPILCVGETLEERESDETEAVVRQQLAAVVAGNGIEAFKNIVIAYEPVWAIGTGRTASPEQAQEVHAFIRAQLADHDANVAQSVRIQYGGSMKPGNAAELLAQPDIDGGLIGGASLKAEDFLGICRAAAETVG